MDSACIGHRKSCVQTEFSQNRSQIFLDPSSFPLDIRGMNKKFIAVRAERAQVIRCDCQFCKFLPSVGDDRKGTVLPPAAAEVQNESLFPDSPLHFLKPVQVEPSIPEDIGGHDHMGCPLFKEGHRVPGIDPAADLHAPGESPQGLNSLQAVRLPGCRISCGTVQQDNMPAVHFFFPVKGGIPGRPTVRDIIFLYFSALSDRTAYDLFDTTAVNIYTGTNLHNLSPYPHKKLLPATSRPAREFHFFHTYPMSGNTGITR